MMPHPPNRGTTTRSEVASNFQAPEELANFGKLRMASVCDGLEFKPHLRGSWGRSPNQHVSAAPTAREAPARPNKDQAWQQCNRAGTPGRTLLPLPLKERASQTAET